MNSVIASLKNCRMLRSQSTRQSLYRSSSPCRCGHRDDGHDSSPPVAIPSVSTNRSWIAHGDGSNRLMFGEADLRRAVSRYLAKREVTERDVVFVHLPDSLASQNHCRRVTPTTEAPPPAKHARQITASPHRPVRSYSRPHSNQVVRPGIRAGAPHFIIWSKDRVLQVELKTARGRLLDIERSFGNALNALGHVYHLIRAETPRHAVEQVEDLLS